jgi:peptidoglycan-associated lipoprotein
MYFVMTTSRRLMLPLALATISIFGAACAKKKVASAPPPPPPSTSETPRPTPVQQPARAEATATPAPSGVASSRTPDAATRARIDELLAKIEDAYFDYNQHTLRPDAVKALQADSNELRDILKDFPDYKLTIEGHADERGSAEYNLALGDERANAAKGYLVQVGIPGSQLTVKSFGKERPVCEEHGESCWQKNRRIHIVAGATL